MHLAPPEAPWSVSMGTTYAGCSWLIVQAAELCVTGHGLPWRAKRGRWPCRLLAQNPRVPAAIVPLVFSCLILSHAAMIRTGSTCIRTRLGLHWMGLGCQSAMAGALFWAQMPGQANVCPPRPSLARAASLLPGLPPASSGLGSIDLFAREDTPHASASTESGVASRMLCNRRFSRV